MERADYAAIPELEGVKGIHALLAFAVFLFLMMWFFTSVFPALLDRPIPPMTPRALEGKEKEAHEKKLKYYGLLKGAIIEVDPETKQEHFYRNGEKIKFKEVPHERVPGK